MSNLNNRAAQALGNLRTDGTSFWYQENAVWRIFDPEHDRNSAHKLLMKLTGVQTVLWKARMYKRWEADDRPDIFDYWIATAPLIDIVETACDVLEKYN